MGGRAGAGERRRSRTGRGRALARRPARAAGRRRTRAAPSAFCTPLWTSSTIRSCSPAWKRPWPGCWPPASARRRSPSSATTTSTASPRPPCCSPCSRACGIEAQADPAAPAARGVRIPARPCRAGSASWGAGLIVTADCGSSSVEAVEAAHGGRDRRRRHRSSPARVRAAGGGAAHQPPPVALHLSVSGSRGGRPRLQAGAGPVGAMRQDGSISTPLLRIACLGTIADLVPLHGENRVIAALGLKALAETAIAGLEGAHPAVRDEAAVHAPPTSASGSDRGSTPPAGCTIRSGRWSCC